MISIFALMESAFAISIICCLDTGRSPTTWRGSMSTPSSSRYLRASFSIFALFSTKPDFISRPRYIF